MTIKMCLKNVLSWSQCNDVLYNRFSLSLSLSLIRSKRPYLSLLVNLANVFKNIFGKYAERKLKYTRSRNKKSISLEITFLMNRLFLCFVWLLLFTSLQALMIRLSCWAKISTFLFLFKIIRLFLWKYSALNVERTLKNWKVTSLRVTSS